MKCKFCGEEGKEKYCSFECFSKDREDKPIIDKLQAQDPRYENRSIQFVVKMLHLYPENEEDIILKAFIATAQSLKIAEDKCIELMQNRK